MNKLISVIIPVYNAVDCLPFCMDCVTGQTYGELEIILVDDGSTDGSGDLCDSWANKDGRIKVFHKENGGVSSARNMGLDACHGDYIGFVDADDRIELQMYEKLVRSIESDNTCDMACCGYFNYPMETLAVRIANGTRKVDPCGPEEAVFYIYERKGYFNSACNKLYRRRRLFAEGVPVYFNEKYYVGEDEAWLAEVLMRCEKISFVSEALYHWWPRSGSAMRSLKLTPQKMTVLDTKKRSMELLPQDEKTQSMLRAVMFNDCHSYKVLAYCSGDKANYQKIDKAIKLMKKDWLRSDRASNMNKAKVMLMEFEMAMHLPNALVRLTSSLRRFGVMKT